MYSSMFKFAGLFCTLYTQVCTDYITTREDKYVDCITSGLEREASDFYFVYIITVTKIGAVLSLDSLHSTVQ